MQRTKKKYPAVSLTRLPLLGREKAAVSLTQGCIIWSARKYRSTFQQKEKNCRITLRLLWFVFRANTRPSERGESAITRNHEMPLALIVGCLYFIAPPLGVVGCFIRYHSNRKCRHNGFLTSAEILRDTGKCFRRLLVSA